MTHVTCRLTAKNRDQLRNPIRSVIEYWLPLPFLHSFSVWRSVKNLLHLSQKIFLSVYVTWRRCSMLCTQNYSLCYGFTIMTSCCLCNVYRPPWCRQVCSEVCLYRCSFVHSSHANLMTLLTLNGTWTAYNTESTPTWSVSLLTYLL